MSASKKTASTKSTIKKTEFKPEVKVETKPEKKEVLETTETKATPVASAKNSEIKDQKPVTAAAFTPKNSAETSKSSSAAMYLVTSTVAIFVVLWLIISAFLYFGAQDQVFSEYKSSQNGLTSLLAEPQFIKNAAGQKISVRYIEGNPENAILVLPDTNGIKGDMLNQLFQYRNTSSAAILIASYPGYDISEGQPNFENTLEAGVLGYDYLVKQGVAEKNITIYGQGWGGVVATHVAKQKPEAGRLVLSNTPSSVQSMCFRNASIFCVFQGFNWNTSAIAKDVKVPTKIFHVRDNSVVPYAEGEALAKSFNQDPKVEVTPIEGDNVTHGYFTISDVLK